MRVLTAEKLFTSLFAAFAVFLLWRSYDYGILSSTITGPGFFPAIAGALILVSTGTSLFSKVKGGESKILDEDGAGNADGPGTRVEVFRVAVLIGFTALFIILAPYVGMIALTPFYVFACFLALAPDFRLARLGVGAGTAITFTLLAWAIFDKALGVPMPRGFF
ncbi:tripartite tricarboxylate transporter TctB family protein [Mesorhizobium sp. DCY119]|uniref:tripartite tricarboxylate transporter TctB family protein n=1 Tax=Mesorhizobium sp. DCY119 TaxID=2108445 RepID=UPI0014035CC0|nr:tripartite tricarboxylate transporter TctB family protein [Mesorhizobium sp. DCY119]